MSKSLFPRWNHARRTQRWRVVSLAGLALSAMGLLPCSQAQPAAETPVSSTASAPESPPVETRAGQTTAAPPRAAAPSGPSGKVLQTLVPQAPPAQAASAPAAAHFTLSWPGCRSDSKRCPYEIAWHFAEPDAQASRGLALDWAAPAGARVRAVPWDLSHGAGEPLAVPSSKRPAVWAAGEEEGTVTASARLLPLPGAALPAVLVSQMAGFEHLKRRHAAYAVVQGQIKKVWSRAETAGPHVSWVLTPRGRPPVHLSVFLQPDDSGPDKLAAHELVWNKAQSTLTERGGASGLHGVVAGTYGSVAEAQAARSAASCLGEYWVIDAQSLKWTLPHRYALLLPASLRAAASAEVARLKRCQPAVQGRVVSLPRLQANPFQ